MNFIDVHCHLDGDCYKNISDLIKNTAAAGVKKIIVSGYDLKTSLQAEQFSREYEMCYFSAGFHPTELKEYSKENLKEIARLAQSPKCVAIGETGLDYHYPDTDKVRQKEAFLSQLELADSLELPVVIHSRDCAEDMLCLLKENARLIKSGALLHCYSHSLETALELQKLGVYFSFGGTSTYSGSKRAKKAIAALSGERLLTETDSPYLPPRSMYGVFPNTPASIPEILFNMANIRGEDPSTTANAVWENAHALFKKLQN